MHNPEKNVRDAHDPVSPYCCAVTVFEYSTTDVKLLPSKANI